MKFVNKIIPDKYSGAERDQSGKFAMVFEKIEKCIFEKIGFWQSFSIDTHGTIVELRFDAVLKTSIKSHQ